jgi:hypothetical protein
MHLSISQIDHQWFQYLYCWIELRYNYADCLIFRVGLKTFVW